MERTLRVRPTPSRDDRRLFTKAAREALIAEARRRRNEPGAAGSLTANTRGAVPALGRPPHGLFVRLEVHQRLPVTSC